MIFLKILFNESMGIGKFFTVFALLCSCLFISGAQVIINDSQIYVIAHRGGIEPGIAENTIPAFQKCVELGVDVIELDLQSTSDRKIIILHDKNVDRTTNGSGPVNAMTLGDVKRLDAGDGYSIPTFQEVIQLTKGKDIKLLLDLKEQDLWYRQEIAEVIKKYDISNQIIIGARSLEDVLYFRQFDNRMKILGFIPDVASAYSFINGGVNIIRFWPDWVKGNSDLMHFCKQNEIPIWVTSGDIGKDEIIDLLNQGITGFIHDSPEKLMKILTEKE